MRDKSHIPPETFLTDKIAPQIPEVPGILLIVRSGGRFSWVEDLALKNSSVYSSFGTSVPPCPPFPGLLFNQLSITSTGVFADGPGAYLFHGVVEQQYVFHVMDYALCLSESKQKSCEKHVDRGGPNPRSMAGPSSLATPSLYVLITAAFRLLIWHIQL